MRLDPSIKIRCGDGVYEPAEDSRLVIEALSVSPGDAVLEIGCGTGMIGLHCAKAGAKVIASDISADAVKCALANASINELEMQVRRGDLLEGIDGKFDLIIFNPPYLPKGPADDDRWTGGGSGLETSLRFLDQCKGRLAEGGRVIIVSSSLSGLKGFERGAGGLGFVCKIAAKEHIFFEDLVVYELTLAPER